MTTRRDFLRTASTLGILVGLPPALVACGDEGDGLPHYRYEGPLGSEAVFEHGVASGDPLADAVVVWTRVTVGELDVDDVDVFLEVAEDPSFRRRVIAESHSTRGARDHTVRLDVTGLLPATTYYYRFHALGRTSPIGRTRTAPAGHTERVRLAVVSCSNVGFGWFYGYRNLAARADLDAIVHLGDYLYEYGVRPEFGEVYGAFREDLDPSGQIVSLDDYRRRYAYYRRDPDLAELHRQNPFIHVWDDHEFACDPFVGGAVNHFPSTQGPWDARVANAIAAYSEWMPTRLGPGGRIYRNTSFGDLVDLVLVDRQRRFLFPAADDGAEYLGREQQTWLDETIESGAATWLVLGTATTFGPHAADGVSGGNWDAASRRRVLDAFARAARENLVVVTGDIHRMEALEIVGDASVYQPGTGVGSAGVEFSSGSVTSPGGNLSSPPPQMPFNDGLNKGYLLLDVTPTELRADFFGHGFILNYFPDPPEEGWLASFVCAAGSNALVAAASPAPAGEARPLAPTTVG